uniref:SSD domain-containing protein n=1 Tax=Ascaris lumbricoides TaxID=6252 RepID=A0A9J2PF95_ASCLU
MAQSMSVKSLSAYGRAFEELFAKGFYSHGKLVGTYPGYFLIGSLVFSGICLTGIPYLKINLDLYKLFVPLDAPVRAEFERSLAFNAMPLGELLNEHPPKNKLKRQVAVPIHSDIIRFYVVHKNYENLLQSETLGKLYRYTNEILRVTAQYEGRMYHFESFCKKEPNEQNCSNTLNVWLKHADILFRDGKTKNNPNLQLSYPVMYLFNRPKDIGNVVYGVNVTGEKHEIFGARVLTLHWFVEFPSTAELEGAYLAYREAMTEFWKVKSLESGLDFIPHNERAMDDEMRLIIETAVPFAIPVSIQLMLFVVLSNYSSDRTKSKPMEAYLAVISVILSLVCTFGILFRLGMAFNPVSSTMPFLILAVGVDDAFLMLGAWRASDRRFPVEKRMALTMSDAGVSITVTSITNFGCFALGYFLCSTPAVADFCILTACGVMLDYIYQITFFAAVMVYGGRKEAEGGLISCCYRNIPLNNETELQVTDSKTDVNTKPYIHRLFGDVYAPFILRSDVMIVSWIAFAAYAILAIYGCSSIIVDISPKKYIRDNSPIQTFVHLADKYIWADNVMPKFYVMNPPDLRDAGARARLNELIYRLEHTKYSIGRVSTNFWLWEYQRFLNDFPDVEYESGFYDQKYLSDFFSQFDYQQYRPHVKMKANSTNGEPCIAAFTFQTSFYGLDSWDKRQVSNPINTFFYSKCLNESCHPLHPFSPLSNTSCKRLLLRLAICTLIIVLMHYARMLALLLWMPSRNVTNVRKLLRTLCMMNLTIYPGHAELFHWRKIISEYEDFDMFLADIFSPFLIDQRKSIAPSSMQSIGSAIAVMAIISIFFLPDKQSVFFMTWSLLSISMGVCGGLSIWGSDLDSVSMGCIVMAIGLAVDFSVHICYRYHRSEELTAHEKVRDTLSVVGWPIVQAGGSTLIGMATLPFIPAYLVRVFFQTVVLVNVIGLSHALIWLPQLISALDPCERIPLRSRHPRSE